ncbi:MAG TPA: DUF11 domain-containing protein [Thermoleophilaceae bacterium]|nr:DUF11 domain-containing protein [Thermoleophilaceae bacterium]
MAVATPAASADPWPCDGSGYLSEFDAADPAAGTLFQRAVRQPNGTYQMDVRGTYADHLNAIGFRPQDGFMYGFDNTNDEFVRIERDAVTDTAQFTTMGFPAGSGLDPATFNFVVGAVLADGTFLLWDSSNERGAIFDVSGPTAQLVSQVTLDPASPASFRGDFAISPVDGRIYGVNPDDPANPTGPWSVYRWDLAGGVLTRGARVADGSRAMGAAWFQPDGTLILYANGTVGTPPEGTGVYGVDLATGQMTFLGAGPAFSNADGTGCANGLSLEKDATPRIVTAGTELTYTHTMTSRALVDANVDFTDQLPPGLTFVPGSVSVSAPWGVTNAYGGSDTLAVSGTISPQQVVTITARVRVSPDHACNVDVRNQSRATLTMPNSPPITVDSDDPTTPTDPIDPTAIHVVCEADVGILKSAATSPLVPGEQATFDFVVTNHGPSTAMGKVVEDRLPAEFSFVSASPGCSEAGGVLRCTIGSLAPGATQRFSVTGRVDSGLDHCLENAATVSGGTPDPNAGNNTSEICVPIRGETDLSIAKTASDAEVGANGQVMFTLVVRNLGPSDDPNAEVLDPLAPGLTLVAARPSQGKCSTAGNELECDLGRLRSGGSAQVLVTAQVAAGQCPVNTARVRGALVDRNLDNNRDSARVCAIGPPPPRFDLAVTKSVSVKRPLIGQTVTYRIVVRNLGPDAAPEAKLTDTLNAPVTVVSVRASQGSCAKRIPMRCELGTIAANQQVTITVRAKHRETGCNQRNAASATGAGTDANPANNMDVVAVCVRKVPLRLSKVASRSVVQGGDVFGYRIRVRNPSRGEAREVRVCDRLPAGLSYVASQPGGQRSGARGRCWTIQRLGARQSRSFRITVRAAQGAIGRKVNTATLRSPDARGGVLRARDRVRILGQPTPVTG